MLTDFIKILLIIVLANFAIICTAANIIFLSIMFCKPKNEEL